MNRGVPGTGLVIRVVFAFALLAAVPANGAVWEVGDDGSVERLDTEVAIARPAAARPSVARPSMASPARAAAFRPMVASAADRYALNPALVDAIAHVESRYDPVAVSPKRARGIMQLMPGTARDLGVDAGDPAANIRGGTAYLRALLDRFDGDIVRTIAAYNAGPAAVVRAKGIPRYPETVSYVSRVLDHMALAAR